MSFVRVLAVAVAVFGCVSATLRGATTDSPCCTPTGTWTCDGSCMIGDKLAGSPETDVMTKFGPGGVFLQNSLKAPTGFAEVEYYTSNPDDCNHYTGITHNRTDLPKGGQVFYEDVIFHPSSGCKQYTKIVKGQIPEPVLCNVVCNFTSSAV